MKYRENYPCVYCGQLTSLEVRTRAPMGLGTACATPSHVYAVCGKHQAEALRDAAEQVDTEVSEAREESRINKMIYG